MIANQRANRWESQRRWPPEQVNKAVYRYALLLSITYTYYVRMHVWKFAFLWKRRKKKMQMPMKKSYIKRCMNAPNYLICKILRRNAISHYLWLLTINFITNYLTSSTGKGGECGGRVMQRQSVCKSNIKYTYLYMYVCNIST